MTKLYILNGPEKGKSHELSGDTVYLGRSSVNDIQINDKSVSRMHLKIVRKEKTFFAIDLGSANGTFADDERLIPGQEFELQDGVPIGMGSVFFSVGKPFSGDVSKLKESIEQARKPNDGFRQRSVHKNLELIYNVASVLMQSLDISETLERILDYIFDLLKRIDRGAIILADSDTGKIMDVISRSVPKGEVGEGTYSRKIVTEVLRKGEPVIYVESDEERTGDRSESMEVMGIKSAMCVPLISRSKTRGVIYVHSEKRHGFREEDLSLLSALSSPAAIAIENAMLYSDLEKTVDDRSQKLFETEKKLRESQARFKATFDNMSSGVVMYEVVKHGEDFLVLDLNAAARRMDNVKKKRVVGKSALEVFPWLREAGLWDAFKRVYKKNRPERQAVTFHQEGKPLSWREYYLYTLPSGELVSIFDDTTDRKKAEEEQKALQEQLLVSQKMESIGGFAGGTAHNFRNILQAISGNIEYLEMLYSKDPEVKELAESIYDSVEKGVDLINSLLHFSKRGGDYQVADLDMSHVIMDTYEIIERVFDKRIQIKLELEKNLFVRGNQSLLSQVFMNLFTNARDAMPEGGVLKIEAKRSGSKVLSTVSDTGHGMDKETQERIFDPFFTLKDVGKGTGLGLSTSLGIVEQHKGSLTVSSKPGRGSTFKIQLPYIKRRHKEKAVPEKKIKYGRGQRVLIVDDEKPALTALENLVKSLKYEPISCENPVEAVKKYKQWTPGAVLMDRSMPELNGVSCIRKILEKDSDARIIIISGYDESGPNGIEEDVKSLIVGYITKPCMLEDLSELLHQAVKK
jgi:signal transduction histidine kinase/ActR/RegA family two-component response regulator